MTRWDWLHWNVGSVVDVEYGPEFSRVDGLKARVPDTALVRAETLPLLSRVKNTTLPPA